MQISIEIDLQESEEEELSLVLGCNQEDLHELIAAHGAAALHEYVSMYLGQKVLRSGRDILEYRLFLLITKSFKDQVPTEYSVANLFHITITESRYLIRSVMSKYQSQLRDAVDQSIMKVLETAIPKEEGGFFEVEIYSQIVIAELRDALARIKGKHPPITKKQGYISTYIIQGDSYNSLLDYYKKEKYE